MEQVSQLQNSNHPILLKFLLAVDHYQKAATQAGFSVLSIDHDTSGAIVPMVVLDLTTETGTKILWDILSSENIVAVHLGLPCGTASLARERPVAPALRAMGVPTLHRCVLHSFHWECQVYLAYTKPRSTVPTNYTGLQWKFGSLPSQRHCSEHRKSCEQLAMGGFGAAYNGTFS